VTRPSLATYAALALRPSAGAWRACAWVFAGGLLAGLIDSAPPLLAGVAAGAPVDALLLAAIPLSALIGVAVLAAFAGCVSLIVRLLRGGGSYGQLSYVFAAFSAPLLIVASVVALLPLSRALLIGLYLYWLALYVVAARGVAHLSRLRAVAAVLGALLITGAAWLAAAFLVGYWGILLPS
jgi:hypothetical protein